MEIENAYLSIREEILEIVNKIFIHCSVKGNRKCKKGSDQSYFDHGLIGHSSC